MKKSFIQFPGMKAWIFRKSFMGLIEGLSQKRKKTLFL